MRCLFASSLKLRLLMSASEFCAFSLTCFLKDSFSSMSFFSFSSVFERREIFAFDAFNSFVKFSIFSSSCFFWSFSASKQFFCLLLRLESSSSFFLIFPANSEFSDLKIKFSFFMFWISLFNSSFSVEDVLVSVVF